MQSPVTSLRLFAPFGVAFLCATPHLLSAQEDLGTIVLNPFVSGALSTETVDSEKLEQEFQGAELSTVLQSIPGVSVQGGDGGDAEIGVNIRGLQDQGRVAVTIDGVRQNFARSGHTANGTFSVDPEMLREVTVTRGPGAKAGAIAGALELRTVRAEDLLTDDGPIGEEYRLRYGTLLARPTAHGALAARLSPSTDVLVALTSSEKDDYTAPDGTRVFASQRTQSGLFKFGLNTENGHRFTFNASLLDQNYIVGRVAGNPRDTDLEQQTYSFGFESFDVFNGWSVDATLYETTSKVGQERLTPALLPTGQTRSYETSTRGVLLTANRGLQTGNLRHDLTVTLDGFRDRVTTDDRIGSLTPSGTRNVWSLSVEDRIEFEAATLTLGLSGDIYRLNGDSGGSSGEALSPRIALEVPIGEKFLIRGAAALGFRPPTLNETLVNGVHPEPADFEIRPNPDLEPERARNIEIGVEYQRGGLFTGNDSLALRATAFRNIVDDFIELERVGGVFDAVFQYENVSRAQIDGLEFEMRYDSDRAFMSLAGQYLDGTNKDTGNELTRVPPERLTLTAGMISADARRTIGARYTVSGAKTGGDFRSESWQTVDLFLTQDIADNAMLSLSLNNILDENYIPHLETEPQPGFNAQISLTLRF